MRRKLMIMFTSIGKLPVLKRNFGWISIFGFCCIIVGSWEGIFITFGIGFTNGGPAGLVYRFIIVWLGTLAVFTSLSELVSICPTSGGQYHWVSLLAPKSSQKLLSYITGWLTVAGWQTAVASSTYIVGTILQCMIQVAKPDYVLQLWHATLLFYATLLFCVGFNTLAGSHLPKTETFLFVMYVVGVVGCVVPLVWLAPRASANEVFTVFLNNGGCNSIGTSFFVGLAGNAFAFLGPDSAYHMSEEIQNAAVVAPRAIISSIVVNGLVGLGTTIAILFFIPPRNELDQGTIVVVLVIYLISLGIAVGSVAAGSRMLWAFARDRGVPGWRVLSKISPKTTIPMNSVICTTVFSLIFGSITAGSPTAFNDVLSMLLAALYSSYLMACGLLLWRRCTGSIKFHDNENDAEVNLPGSAGNLVWGPFRLPGAFGIAVNTIACAYLIIILIFCFWPTVVPVTAATMNYSSLVFGTTGLFSAFYYVIQPHETYNGPIIEIELGH